MSLRIGAYAEKPYAFGCFMRLPKRECAKPGYEIEFIDVIMRIAELDYVMVTNGALGEQESNDSMLSDPSSTTQSGQVDLMSYFLRMTATRREEMVFSFPITSYSQFYVAHTPSLQLKYSDYVFLPFQLEVWMTLIIALLAVITTQWLVKCRLNDRQLSMNNFMAAGWNTASSILRFKAPGPKRPKSIAAAIIGTIWLLMWSIVLIKSYRTTLIGTLVVKRQVTPLPFRSLDELISKLAEKTLVLTGTADGSMQPACVADLCDRLNETLLVNPVQIVMNPVQTGEKDQQQQEQQKQLLAEPNYVTSMMLEDDMRYSDSFLFADYPKPFPIGIIDSHYPSAPVGIALRSNIPRLILDKLNRAIVTAMPGYVNMIRRYRRYYPPVTMDLSLRGHQEGIKMVQFRHVLLLWVGGTAGAAIVFLAELLSPPTKHHRKIRSCTELVDTLRTCFSTTARVQVVRIGGGANRINNWAKLLRSKSKV